MVKQTSQKEKQSINLQGEKFEIHSILIGICFGLLIGGGIIVLLTYTGNLRTDKQLNEETSSCNSSIQNIQENTDIILEPTLLDEIGGKITWNKICSIAPDGCNTQCCNGNVCWITLMYCGDKK